jgi:hypothetical protein
MANQSAVLVAEATAMGRILRRGDFLPTWRPDGTRGMGGVIFYRHGVPMGRDQKKRVIPNRSWEQVYFEKSAHPAM